MILKSINNQKKRNILLIIQLSIGFFMMFLILGVSEYYSQTSIKSQRIIEQGLYNVWFNPKGIAENYQKLTSTFKAVSEIDYASIKPEVQLPKAMQLIKKDNRIEAAGKQYSTVLYKDELNNSNINSIKANTDNLVVICNDEVSDKFFNYQIIKGQNFNDYHSDADKKNNIIPILVGAPLVKQNPIDSIVEIPECINTATEKAFKFRVIGVLNPVYPSLIDFNSSGSLENGGYVVIIPKLVIYSKEIKSDYQDIVIKLKNKKDVNKIEKEYTKEIGGCNIQIHDISSSIESIKSNGANAAVTSLGYCIVVLLLSCFGIISVSLSSLAKRKKEIGIRFAIGAKKKHIVSLLEGEYIILFLAAGVVSFLIALIVSNFIKNGNDKMIYVNLHIVGITSITIFIFMIISILPLIREVYKLNPIELIKEK